MRYRGRGEDFATAHFVALFDRGLAPTDINQGGQDIFFNGRHDFDPDEHTRAVATASISALMSIGRHLPNPSPSRSPPR